MFSLEISKFHLGVTPTIKLVFKSGNKDQTDRLEKKNSTYHTSLIEGLNEIKIESIKYASWLLVSVKSILALIISIIVLTYDSLFM